MWCWMFYSRMWEGCTTDVLDLEGLSPVMEPAVESWMAKLFGGGTLKPTALLAVLVTTQLETDEVVVQQGPMRCSWMRTQILHTCVVSGLTQESWTGQHMP